MGTEQRKVEQGLTQGAKDWDGNPDGEVESVRRSLLPPEDEGRQGQMNRCDSSNIYYTPTICQALCKGTRT